MKLITLAGPPSCGKTAVLTKVLNHFTGAGKKAGVVKFDCLSTEDEKTYRHFGIPVKKGLSAELCPDHYFITNIEDAFSCGETMGFDYLFTESAGLCNRCSPHIKDVPAVCVVDQLSGVHTPVKIGPMLKTAALIVITKSDIVSQAELFHINGQGTYALYSRIVTLAADTNLISSKLRFPMPMALCSYCLGETKIGKQYQIGNVRKIDVHSSAGG
ncbi:MAG: hypothetical protein LBQ88_20645 [Treponema sp.]|jgi:Ni2+-binding GTPase involved in maturation of urease and hydrogenase|nr:hypothetical protein [Treponema sp.]